MKIRIDARELKTITDKSLCNIEKKSSLYLLKCIKLEVSNGILKLTATTIDKFLILTTENFTSISDGSICIDSEDFSLLLKMKNEIELIEQDGILFVKNGSKTLKMQLQKVDDFPEIPQEEQKEIFKIKESEFAEVLKNLQSFTYQDDNRPILTCYNFNLESKRIEALDGYRIGMKTLASLDILDSETKSITLQNTAYDSLKKAIREKGEITLTISKGEKYICVSGEGFSFYNRIVEGEYLNVEQTISNTYDHSFTVNTKEFEQVVKYNLDILKASGTKEKCSMKLYAEKSSLQSYFKTDKFETIDKMETENLNITNVFKAAFNASYLYEALKIVNAKKIQIKANGQFHPMMIYGEQYSFLVLPVKVDAEDWEQIAEKIKQDRAV